MALQVPPELEQRVTAIANATQREPQAVLADLLGAALEDDEALRLEVAAGDAEIERGEGIDHREAMRRLDSRLEQLGPRPR